MLLDSKLILYMARRGRCKKATTYRLESAVVIIPNEVVTYTMKIKHNICRALFPYPMPLRAITQINAGRLGIMYSGNQLVHCVCFRKKPLPLCRSEIAQNFSQGCIEDITSVCWSSIGASERRGNETLDESNAYYCL